MPQGMNSAPGEADFLQDPAKRAVEVVPIRGIPDPVSKNVGAGLAGVIGGPCAASFEAFPQIDAALFFQQGTGLLRQGDDSLACFRLGRGGDVYISARLCAPCARALRFPMVGQTGLRKICAPAASKTIKPEAYSCHELRTDPF